MNDRAFRYELAWFVTSVLEHTPGTQDQAAVDWIVIAGNNAHEPEIIDMRGFASYTGAVAFKKLVNGRLC